MNKNRVREYIVLAVVFIVFSVVAFAAPFTRNGIFWLAYLFAVIAIAFQVYVLKSSFTDNGDARSKFYGFPIARVGLIYLAIQIVLSFVELLLAGKIAVWVAVIINIFPLAYAIIGCVATEAMRDEIERQDKQLKKDVSNMRNLQSMAESLVGQCSDEKMSAIVKKLSDELRYSDPVTSIKSETYEKNILAQMNDVQQAVLDNDIESVNALCNRILVDLAERNRVCAIDKRG